jgi:hypothetical protein
VPKQKQDPTKDPSTTSGAFNTMSPVWDKINTILAGTGAMRASNTTYLPKHEKEKDSAYGRRLEISTLLNMTQLTLDSWVGRPFSDPVQISEDMPDDFKPIFDNVDLQGDGIGVFSRNWFKEGLAKAFAHVLVDFPLTGPRTNRSLADDRQENLRPYWSFIAPENLFFASSTIHQGQEVLTHIRIRENEIVRIGFAESLIQRIRVFDRFLPGELMPDMVDLEGNLLPEVFDEGGALRPPFMEGGVFVSTWVRVEKKGGDEEWIMESPPFRIDIEEIPLVTFYADRQGLMMGKPPSEDLVDLNIRHWQTSSDQNNILVATRFPILAVSGVTEDEADSVIGPNRTLSTPSDQGKWYYVEHSGKAIAAGRQDMLDLEEQMAHYGADFLRKRPGSATATAKALDSAEATSPLQDATIRFNDALANAVRLTAMWMNMDPEAVGTVSVQTDFGPEEILQGDLQELGNARRARDLSRQNYLEELKRRGALDDEFDPDENEKQLEEERTASMSEFGLVGGQEINPEDEDDESELDQ